MDSDDHPPPLCVRITDALGCPLRRPGLARWLTNVAPAHARGELAIALVSDATMRRLHRQFAGASHVTDVLSFPTVGPSDRRPSTRFARSGRPEPAEGRTSGPSVVHLGDVVIAVGVAARHAKALGHPLGIELRVLALHGLLHVLGYDHATDDGEMARLEGRLRRKGGLAEGLIARARSGQAGRPRRSRKPAGAGGAAAKAGRRTSPKAQSPRPKAVSGTRQGSGLR
jgi:probable rRNA maturation factor